MRMIRGGGRYYDDMSRLKRNEGMAFCKDYHDIKELYLYKTFRKTQALI
jgi:hypothetical protein